MIVLNRQVRKARVTLSICPNHTCWYSWEKLLEFHALKLPEQLPEPDVPLPPRFQIKENFITFFFLYIIINISRWAHDF